MLGTYVLSAGYYDAFYLKALQVRTLLRRDYDQAFTKSDVIVMPTSPIPPFTLGEKTDDPLQMYLADIFTVSVNLTGLPGVSIPCGFTEPAPPRPGQGESSEKLPIGFQVIGRMFDESTMLRVADAYERATNWPRTAPV
jgi:aspartyl-tRNA(Asn)/glutamyl-tRNA(Gln) amidotransferase subunit A